jgi:menaquinone-dependent protoporphyrinogen oxidase
MNRVLVVFATKNGSTREVAEAIAAVMRSDDVDVEIATAREAKGSVGDRDLVVVGGAIYSGRWHRDAHRFLKRHREELAAMPVAVFGMGPRVEDAEAWRHSREQLDRALARRPWLSPRAVTVFGGVDPPRRADRPRRDVRDWDAIRAWSRDLQQRLPEVSPAPHEHDHG